MSKQYINLGKDCDIDLPALLETGALVQANSGGGKSYLLRRLLEQSYGKVQQIVIDLEGEFATLREKFPEYLLLGRKDGDLPLSIRTAELLARKLLDLGCNAILDLSELKHHERITFVKRFLDSMIDAPKELWHPVLVIIDEAHQFCPEAGKCESTNSVIDLCTRGRKRGFRAVLATQRISKLHKDAAAECNNKLIGRTGLDIDMKRAGEELGFTSKAQNLELRTLEAGEFFVFGPAITLEIRKIKVGEVKTTHWKAGLRNLGEVPPATNAVKKLLERITDLPKEAEKELKTVQDLQSEVRSLRGQLSQSKVQPKADPEQIKRLQMAINTAKKETAELRLALKKESERRTKSVKLLQGIVALLDKEEKVFFSAKEMDDTYFPQPNKVERDIAISTLRDARKAADQVIERHAPREKVIVTVDGEVSNSQMRILQNLKRLMKIGFAAVSRPMIAGFCGISFTTGTFKSNVSALKTMGFLEYVSGGLQLTEQGINLAGDVDPPTSSEELQQNWMRVLTNPQKAILQLIIERYPQSISREDLASQLNVSHTTGTFKSNVSRLKTFQAIEYEGNGCVKASKNLFLEAF